MSVYTLQGPDGRTYTIEGPEGATAEQLGSFVQSQAQAAERELYSPTRDMSGLDKFIVGAGKAVSDTGQGIGQIGAGIMDYLRPRKSGQSRVDEARGEVAETRRLDAPLMDTGAGLAGNIGGNIAMALLPGGAVAGAGRALTRVPAAAQIGQALATAGRGLMAPNTIPAAMGVGALQGAIQPSTSTGETMMNAGLGGVAAGAVPAVIRSGQIAKALIDPKTETGQKKLVGRALLAAAGSPEDAAKALANLRASQQPFVGPAPEGEVGRQIVGEIVPGSFPTTGQAAGVPSIASLSRSAGAVDPQSQNALSQRLAEQNAARYRQVEDIAGSTGGRDFMAINRKAFGDQAYEEARKLGINPGALTPEAQANIASFQQRVPDEVMQRARDLAKIKGIDLDNSTSVQGLHWIKTALDDKISTAKRQGDKELASAYIGLQQDFLGGLDELSPAYKAARQEYSAMSKPINEMDVAQEVLNKSTSALPRATDNPALAVPTVRPEAFAKALSDKTASNVVRPGATLEGVMQPRNLQKLQNIEEDLARSNFGQNAGRESGGSDTTQKLAFANLMSQSGLPKWVSPELLLTGLGTAGGSLVAGPMGAGAGAAVGALTKAGARQFYQDANTEMSRKLAEALLNPQSAISAMEAGMVTPEMQRLVRGLSRGGAAVGAASPYLLNTTKE